jgi:hypothetical protein
VSRMSAGLDRPSAIGEIEAAVDDSQPEDESVR